MFKVTSFGYANMGSYWRGRGEAERRGEERDDAITQRGGGLGGRETRGAEKLSGWFRVTDP